MQTLSIAPLVSILTGFDCTPLCCFQQQLSNETFLLEKVNKKIFLFLTETDYDAMTSLRILQNSLTAFLSKSLKPHVMQRRIHKHNTWICF